MAKKLLIIHGGAPTAVWNASLYGILREARQSSSIEEIYGAAGGFSGALNRRFIPLHRVPESDLKTLPGTPGSAIGSSRDPLEAKDYEALSHLLREERIDLVILSGGNGTMDACKKLFLCIQCLNLPIQVAGLPKTIDNDLLLTDHAPGFPSAARFMAASVREITADVRSLPIHVCIVEAMGRNAGFLAASSALAGERGLLGPDLIYVPERPFSEDAFLRDVKSRFEKGKGVVAVVSEGITGPGKKPLVPPLLQTGRATYFGDVSAHLAQLVIERLGIKARSEKPGILSRSSAAWQSTVDVSEAAKLGQLTVKNLLLGKSGFMTAIERLSSEPYEIRFNEVPLTELSLDHTLLEKCLPDAFISPEGNYVTEAFSKWARPLLGAPLPPFFPPFSTTQKEGSS